MALREVFARFRTQFDGSALAAGNRQVQGLTSQLGTGLGALRNLGAAFAGLAIVSIVRSWISAVADFVSEMAHVGDELDKTSRTLGIGTSELQSWRHAANLSGVDASALSGSLRRLGANMGAAAISPTSAAALEFRRLGVELRGADGQLRDMSDVMIDIADPIAAMGASTQRVATLTALFGRQGASLGVMFEGGSEGVRAMRAELEALGGGASQEMIQAAADLTDANARLDLSMLSIKSRIAVALLPIIENLTEAITTVTSWFARNRAASLALEVTVVTLAAVIGILAVILLIILSPVILLIVFLFGTLFLIVGTVVLVIQDLYTWITGGESLIGGFVESMLAAAGISWEPIRREITDTMDTLREAYNSIAGTLGLPTIDASTAGPDTSSAGPKRESSTPGAASGPPELSFGQHMVQGLRNGSAEFRAGPAVQNLARGGGAGRTEQTVQQTNNLTFQGMADPSDFEAVARRVLDRSNRDAVEALGQ